MKFAVAVLLTGSASGALVAMTACYDSTMVTDSASYTALASVNNAKNLINARNACDATSRSPAVDDVTTEKKAIIDSNVMLAMGFPYQMIYGKLTIPAAIKTANIKRFSDFGTATGVGAIACAIDTTSTGCAALVGTFDQQSYVVKTAMDFYAKAHSGCVPSPADDTVFEKCLDSQWTGFLKVGGDFKTDSVLEKDTAGRDAWAKERNSKISKLNCFAH